MGTETSGRRAMLTDREREIVSGDADVEDEYRYQTISRIRQRFNRIEGDLSAMEGHGELAVEFREIVREYDIPDLENQEMEKPREVYDE